ncbi:hypothetical protein VTJ04DRAFT_10048 [Mycothermus thermophilus]|uniref:uncharacterized protein n=1 Tax=Humicola insolens TaxID=85995 RepID=UPI003743BE5C
MAALNLAVVPRDTFSHIAKRSNWAGENAGVVLVFCIVFVVGVGLIGLWIYKAVLRRRENKKHTSHV